MPQAPLLATLWMRTRDYSFEFLYKLGKLERTRSGAPAVLNNQCISMTSLIVLHSHKIDAIITGQTIITTISVLETKLIKPIL